MMDEEKVYFLGEMDDLDYFRMKLARATNPDAIKKIEEQIRVLEMAIELRLPIPKHI